MMEKMPRFPAKVKNIFSPPPSVAGGCKQPAAGALKWRILRRKKWMHA